MTLGEYQRKFTLMTAKLIIFAYDNGFELAYGETYRTPEQAALNAKKGSGIKNSLHLKKLAVDFDLFKDGVWLKKTEDHRLLGKYWKSMGGSWGGDWGDGNHYSLSPDGGKTR